MKKQEKKTIDWIGYYDDENMLYEIIDEDIDLRLGDRLRHDILSGKRNQLTIQLAAGI